MGVGRFGTWGFRVWGTCLSIRVQDSGSFTQGLGRTGRRSRRAEASRRSPWEPVQALCEARTAEELSQNLQQKLELEPSVTDISSGSASESFDQTAFLAIMGGRLARPLLASTPSKVQAWLQKLKNSPKARKSEMGFHFPECVPKAKK